MRRIRKMMIVLGLTGALVLSLTTAAQAASCGGPWTGPMSTTCGFTSTGTTLTFGGIGFGSPNAAVGITIFSPPGVYLTGCSAWTPGGPSASCGPTSVSIPAGQVVICEVKGLNTGFYFCNA